MLAYLSAALWYAVSGTACLSSSGWGHVALVLLPVPVSAAFYAWLSQGAKVVGPRRYLQVTAAGILAPFAAASIIAFIWFIALGHTM